MRRSTARILGNARKHGAQRIALAVARELKDCGEIAVLLGQGGDVIVLPHWHPDYEDVLVRRSCHVCGVYRAPADGALVSGATAHICDDMVARWADLQKQARAVA
jgi:hypothetical protein